VKNNWFLTIVMLAMFTFILVACGGGNSNSTGNTVNNNNNENETENANNNDEGEDADLPEFISLLTGGTSGTYYPLGGAIAKIILDETGIQVDALSSNASADNVMALKDGEAELAFVQTDVMADAASAINAFDEPVDNVLGMGSLYPETIQIVTIADSGIETVEDLAGKKVSVGAPGSGTYINAEQILEVHGMTMDDIEAQNLDFGESSGGIKDGNIDAAFITAGTPTGAVEELQATSDVHIVPVAADKAAELIDKYPYYATDTIPAGTYGLEEAIDTVAVLAMLVVRDDISEDAVYEMTKALYENADSIAHAKAEYISIENAVDGIGVELHPGAMKYYMEAGLEVQ